MVAHVFDSFHNIYRTFRLGLHSMLFFTKFRLSWIISVSEFEDAGCVDEYPTKECKEFAAIEGYCDDHKEFMETRCAKSCGFCQRKSF